MAVSAWAAPRARKPPSGLAAEILAQLRAELASERDDVAAAAARRLGEIGGPEAVEPLVSALAVGVSPLVAAEALAALGALRDGRAVPVLLMYAGNMNVPVRVAAVKALGALSDPRVAEVLIDRLGDAAAPVRAAAAEALAARKERRAEKRLLALVTKNDLGAAGPLGVLIAPDAVPRLAELQGRVDDEVLATALGEFLKRPEIPDRLRLDVVRTVGRLPGAGATAALVEYLASVPETENRPSKEEAQKLLDRRGTP